MGASVEFKNRHVADLECRRHCAPDHVVLKAQLLKLCEVADARGDSALKEEGGYQGTSNRLYIVQLASLSYSQN